MFEDFLLVTVGITGKEREREREKTWSAMRYVCVCVCVCVRSAALAHFCLNGNTLLKTL